MIDSPTKLITQPYRWDLVDGNDGENTELYCWSLDRENNPYLIRFPNPPVFCYVELPTIVDNRRMVWDEEAINHVNNYLNVCVNRNKEIFRLEIVTREKLYYYHGNQKP